MGKRNSWRLDGSGRSRIATMALGVLVVAGGVAVSTPADAQIASTRHNLGSTGTIGNHLSANTGSGEICVFCHTPHGADTSASVPLWNRVLPTGTGYQTYASLGTSTLDGATTTNVGSVSIACLSCHDGTQAMNTVINAPGSGNFNPTTGVSMGGTWTGGNVTADGKIQSGITLIGTDLRNDHPIGIQYAGGGVSSTTPSPAQGATTDPDFVQATTGGTGSSTIWWVNTSAPGSNANRQKTDMVLYTRPSSDIGVAGGTVEPFVECASCHDPHTTNATFLRISNSGSAVCLACHIK